MSFRIIVADDHEVVRSGLRSILAGSEFEIIAEAANVDDVVRLACEMNPDIVLMEIRLANGDGLNALSRIKAERPSIPVLIFSGYDNPTYIAHALALHAVGYLTKTASRAELLAALQRAASGETVWTREELRRVTGALATPRLNGDIDAPLTQRESEVLRQLAVGLTNKEIANSLHISYETVKEHVQHILRKIGVVDRTQAAVWAVRKGLV
jgi:DNA-binding NarL/FixJ family response regulator